MIAFKHIQNHTGEMEFALNNIPFYKAELTPEEEALVVNGKCHEEYYILREWEFESHAENDGGIDAFDFGEEEIPLSPEESIIFENEVIGFCHGTRLFLFKERTGFSFGNGGEFVGGWGYVSSNSTYTLQKR